MRQIVLDTETTGLKFQEGHRIVEIGAVELINRHITDNTFHEYINPERDMPEEAFQIHGITSERLADSPVFRDIAAQFWEYLGDAELVIHNAAFDVGFLNHEFGLLDNYANDQIDPDRVVDTLDLARSKHPGQRNDLDSLCRRYGIDNAKRKVHGALLDAELLANVYLQMTGGQATLFKEQSGEMFAVHKQKQRLEKIADANRLKRVQPTVRDLELHEKWLALLRKNNPGNEPIAWDRVPDAVNPGSS